MTKPNPRLILAQRAIEFVAMVESCGYTLDGGPVEQEYDKLANEVDFVAGVEAGAPTTDRIRELAIAWFRKRLELEANDASRLAEHAFEAAEQQLEDEIERVLAEEKSHE